MNITKTPLFQNVKEILDEDQKEYSINTYRAYYDRLNWIKRNLNIASNQPKTIIKDADKIIDATEKSTLKIATKALTFVVLTQLATKLEVKKEILDKYVEKQDQYKNLNNTARRQNKVADRKRWATLADLINVIDEIPADSFSNKQDRLIIGLYLLLNGIVMRLDFAGAKVYYDKAKGTHNENWLHVDTKDNKYEFHLNDYKTKQRYKSKVIPITNEKLKNILKDWLEINTGKYLLLSYKNKDLTVPLSDSGLSNRIRNIFSTYLGKKIGNQQLRQIYESDVINSPEYDKLNLDQKIKLHENLFHSYETGHEYMKR